jgi:hypothetical protein
MPRKHFDTSGKSAALLHHHAISKTPMALPYKGSSARLQAKNPYPQLKLHRLATANDRLRVAEPRALPMRVA